MQMRLQIKFLNVIRFIRLYRTELNDHVIKYFISLLRDAQFLQWSSPVAYCYCRLSLMFKDCDPNPATCRRSISNEQLGDEIAYCGFTDKITLEIAALSHFQ